jgi:WhiB family redox-sensing transcriptional regulator
MADLRRLPGPVAERWEWQLRGACRDLDQAIFFTSDLRPSAHRTRLEALAKAVCAACPVMLECREHAFRVREPFGVWGGLTPGERRDELRDRDRAVHAA